MKPETRLMLAIFGGSLDPQDDDYYESVNGISLREALYEAMRNIKSPGTGYPSYNARYLRVLKLRFGFEDGRSWSLKETGAEFDLSRERIRQIEAKALRKLRHPQISRKLKAYIKGK